MSVRQCCHPGININNTMIKLPSRLRPENVDIVMVTNIGKQARQANHKKIFASKTVALEKEVSFIGNNCTHFKQETKTTRNHSIKYNRLKMSRMNDNLRKNKKSISQIDNLYLTQLRKIKGVKIKSQFQQKINLMAKRKSVINKQDYLNQTEYISQSNSNQFPNDPNSIITKLNKLFIEKCCLNSLRNNTQQLNQKYKKDNIYSKTLSNFNLEFNLLKRMQDSQRVHSAVTRHRSKAQQRTSKKIWKTQNDLHPWVIDQNKLLGQQLQHFSYAK